MTERTEGERTEAAALDANDAGQQPEAQPDPLGSGVPNEVLGVQRGMYGAGRQGGDTSGYGGLVRTVQLPGAAQRPYGSYFDEVADALVAAVPAIEGAVERVVVHRDQLTFQVTRERLIEVLQALRDDPALRFELCLGSSGVHYPDDVDRELHVAIHLRSLTHNRMLRVETTCPEHDPHVPSTVALYPTNDWHERETYDMFGIVFDGHPALTRILMPDDWPGHPQRKDYPLGGVPVEYKGAQIPPPDERRAYTS